VNTIYTHITFQLLYLQCRVPREACANSASHATWGWTRLWAFKFSAVLGQLDLFFWAVSVQAETTPLAS